MTDNTTIMDTGNIAEIEDDFEAEREDLTATTQAEDGKMNFFVQMNGHTMSDFEDMVVNAAAAQILCNIVPSRMQRLVEERCISLITERIDKHLGSIVADIVNQPLTQPGRSEPITMAEHIGIVGRDYMATTVNSKGEPEKRNGWGSNVQTRAQHLVSQVVDRDLKRHVDQETRKTIAVVREEIKSHQQAILEQERKRVSDAIKSLSEPK